MWYREKKNILNRPKVVEEPKVDKDLETPVIEEEEKIEEPKVEIVEWETEKELAAIEFKSDKYEDLATAIVEVQNHYGEKRTCYSNLKHLKVGDWVNYKVWGTNNVGVVVQITQCNEVKRLDEFWVRRIINTDVNGTFLPYGKYLYSNDANLFAETFCCLYSKKYQEEYISFYEEVYNFSNFEKDIDEDWGKQRFKERGKALNDFDAILYLGWKNGRGFAYVQGRETYAFQFNIKGKRVYCISCECPVEEPCKHQYAVLYKLKELFEYVQGLDKLNNFVLIRKDALEMIMPKLKGEITIMDNKTDM